MDDGALGELRIADLTIITAGANATQMLADLGADVIKVESGRYPDPFRSWQGPAAAGSDVPPDPWNWSPTFNMVNRNKRGICLDLKHPRGREVFLRLVSVSDAVTENFRQGVLDRLGLGYDVLRRAKPGIILLSLGSQGSTGPESRYGSYGSTLDALSGLMSVTGYEDSPPVWSGQEVNYPDQVASVFGMGMLLAAVRHRNRTGEGGHVDVSQRELVTTMLGEHVLEYTIGKTLPRPCGNADPRVPLQGCFRCAGDDAWVAISVETDAEWRALCATLGRPELADDERYRTALGRARHQAALRPVIEAWTRQHARHDAMHCLQAEGVPAGAVQTAPDLHDDPQLAHRGYYTSVENVRAGRQRLRVAPYRLSATPPAIRRPAPALGQDTHEVLRDVLGYSADEISELEALGVTTNTPGGRGDA